jgi:hypothetical protein
MKITTLALTAILCACSISCARIKQVASPRIVKISELLRTPEEFDNALISLQACLLVSPHGSLLFSCKEPKGPFVVVRVENNPGNNFSDVFVQAQDIFASTKQLSASFIGKFHRQTSLEVFGEQRNVKNVIFVSRVEAISIAEP